MLIQHLRLLQQIRPMWRLPMRTQLLRLLKRWPPLRPKPPLQLKRPRNKHQQPKRHLLQNQQPQPMSKSLKMMSTLPESSLQRSRPKWMPKSKQSKIRELNKQITSKYKVMIQPVNYRVS
jgi:hypothetical protein